MRVYTDDHLRPEEWMTGAACATTDPDLWFPRTGDQPAAQRAKRVCREACPVRDQCLEYALRTNQQAGIWGGMAAKSLQRLRRNRA